MFACLFFSAVSLHYLASVQDCMWRVYASALFCSLDLQRLSWNVTESAQAEEESPESRAWSSAGPFSCFETGYCG